MLLVIVSLIAIIFAMVLVELPKYSHTLLKVIHFMDPIIYHPTFRSSKYVEGIFRPLEDETFNYPLKIKEGEIIPDIQGLYLLNGPNPTKEQMDTGYHWFDGHGMIRSIRIGENSANYSCQWIQTPRYELDSKYHLSTAVQIGEMVGVVGLLKVLFVHPLLQIAFKKRRIEQTPANTALLLYQNQLYALHEAGLPFKIELNLSNSSKIFESIGYESFNNTLNFPFTAHPKVDPADGRLYFIGYQAGIIGNTETVLKAGRVLGNDVETYFPVHAKVTPFIHDLLLTEDHMVIIQSSALFEPKGILKGNIFPFSPKHSFKVGLLPKSSTNDSSIKWFDFGCPIVMIHGLNAWQEGNEIKLYGPAGTAFQVNDPVENQFAMAEIRINVVTNETSITYFDNPHNITVEFPTIKSDYLGRKANYGYALQFEPSAKVICPAVVKYDLFKKIIDSVIYLPPTITGFEPMLIPKKSSARALNMEVSGPDLSDEVYIAIMGYNITNDESEWFVYDGTTMSSEPVLRLGFEGMRSPMGFHGLWIGEEALASMEKY